MGQLVRRTVVITATVLSVILLLIFVYFTRWILLVAGLGIGVGVLLAPGVKYLRAKLSVPKGLSAFFLLIAFLAALSGLGYLIYIVAANEIAPLINEFPKLLLAGQDRLAGLFDRFPAVSSALRNVRFGGLIEQSAESVVKGLKAGVGIVTFGIYLLATSLYFSTSSDRYKEGVLTLFPKGHQGKIRTVLEQSATVLRKWFMAQLIAMSCVGACASIGFLIIGLDYWPVLGLITALLDIVPFVGPTIAALCAVLVAVGQEPIKAVWVIVNFIIVEHIESNLVIPLVMKERVDLPPIQLLTFMLILADWFGLLGVLVAPPMLTLIRTLYVMVYVPSINAGEIKVEQRKSA